MITGDARKELLRYLTCFELISNSLFSIWLWRTSAKFSFIR